MAVVTIMSNNNLTKNTHKYWMKEHMCLLIEVEILKILIFKQNKLLCQFINAEKKNLPMYWYKLFLL